jgi:hypothetical protein
MKVDEDLASPPRSLSTKTVSDKKCASKHTSSALCLWLIAILSRLNSDAQYSDMILPRSLCDEDFAKDNDIDTIEPEYQGVLLDEELLAFSSFRRIDLNFQYTLECFDYTGSVKWRQLVARWR